MTYIGTVINDSSTIIGRGAQGVKDALFLAAAFDAEGNFAIAGAGAPAVGIVIPDQGDSVPEEVTLQVKNIGKWKAGAAFAAGDLLQSDAEGKAVTATAGAFVLAQALEAAEADAIARVQIIKAGTI